MKGCFIPLTKNLLKEIENHQDLSVYELSKKIGWKVPQTRKTVKRLSEQNKILIKVIERGRCRIDLISSKNRELDKIEIPINLIKIGNPTWSTQAKIYALDSSTIGISGKKIEEWEEHAEMKDSIPIDREKEKLILRIPEKFMKFYNLNRKAFLIGVNGNNLLLTITDEITKFLGN